MNAAKTPLKRKPLPLPGESLKSRIDSDLMETAAPWMATAIFALLWAGWEWLRFAFSLQVSPVAPSIAAVCITIYAGLQVRKFKIRARRMHQGMLGEQVVGQFLETLRRWGYVVIHDVQEDGYNIDHVLIGPTGVYAIETKTFSKPVGRDATIVYDGQAVIVDGHKPDRDPLKQAEACADRISEILRDVTGEQVFVRPVVVFPGWYVRRTCRSPKIWVVNEEHLPAWLDHEDERLDSSQVHRYSSALASHVRSKANAGV